MLTFLYILAFLYEKNFIKCKKVHPVRHTSLIFTLVKLFKRPEVNSEPAFPLHLYVLAMVWHF